MLLKEENRERLFVSDEKYFFFPEDPQWHLDALTLPRLFDEGGTLPPDYPRSHYGYGWGIIASIPQTGKIVEHTGGIPGFHTIISRYTDTKNCIVILSNIVDDTRDLFESVPRIERTLEEQLLKIQKVRPS